jgi:hypothetical protein
METVEQRRALGVKVPALGLTDEQLGRVSRAVQSAVDRYARVHLAPPDELRQEAWLQAAMALPRWDPAKGAIGPYVGRAIDCGVPRAMSRLRCPVSLSKHAAENGVGYGIAQLRQEDVAAGGFRSDAALLERREDDSSLRRPDVAVERADRDRRVALAAEKRRQAYRRAAARLRPPLREFAEAFMARVWLGHEVPDPAELAEELSVCTVEEARRAMSRMRRALREDPDVAEALDAYDEED